MVVQSNGGVSYPGGGGGGGPPLAYGGGGGQAVNFNQPFNGVDAGGGYLPNSQSALLLNTHQLQLPSSTASTLPVNTLSSGGMLMDSRNTLNNRLEYNLNGAHSSAGAVGMGMPQGSAPPKQSGPVPPFLRNMVSNSNMTTTVASGDSGLLHTMPQPGGGPSRTLNSNLMTIKSTPSSNMGPQSHNTIQSNDDPFQQRSMMQQYNSQQIRKPRVANQPPMQHSADQQQYVDQSNFISPYNGQQEPPPQIFISQQQYQQRDPRQIEPVPL
ncbi:hypothetical protein FGO68_gene10582 [Halteria grandinella]|uniref:Uncharacterized protein n=1 Tax=Halteria grandinella TaxID=5974 RepID=A0A8J8P4F1_HALGN|nr:hypothetical protein FGO68_gene10582 [Halteria grandinella]